MFFKKKKIIQTIEQPITPCPANQKPECSLIEELRNIQTELSTLKEDYFEQKREIAVKLFGTKWTGIGYRIERYDYSAERYIGQPVITPPLLDFLEQGIHFKNTKTLENIIELIQEYISIVEKENQHQEYKEHLIQKALQIKQQLGIK